jgi:hypothetical protein
MTAQDALVWISIIGGVGTGINLILTLVIRNAIMGLKLWANEKFVAKDDMTTYLSPIKDSIQMVGSARRLQGLDPQHPV